MYGSSFFLLQDITSVALAFNGATQDRQTYPNIIGLI